MHRLRTEESSLLQNLLMGRLRYRCLRPAICVSVISIPVYILLKVNLVASDLAWGRFISSLPLQTLNHLESSTKGRGKKFCTATTSYCRKYRAAGI